MRRFDPSRLSAPAPRRIIPEPFLFGSVMYETASAVEWVTHSHNYEHELVWPLAGTVFLRLEGRAWTVLAGQGAWLRAGEQHEVSTKGAARLGVTHLRADIPEASHFESGITLVDPALRELLIYLNRAQLDLAIRLRLQRACLDLMTPAREPLMNIPIPDDPRLTPLVSTLLEDCADPRSLGEWAQTLEMSTRTLNRAMIATVGMSFGQWRRRVRISDAHALIADGASVATAASYVGYASPSALIASFRAVTGRTPARGASWGDATRTDLLEALDVQSATS